MIYGFLQSECVSSDPFGHPIADLATYGFSAASQEGRIRSLFFLSILVAIAADVDLFQFVRLGASVDIHRSIS